MEQNDISHRLKVYIFTKGISQKELSRKTKIVYPDLNKFFNGWLKLNEVKTKKICKALGLDFEKFKNNEIIEVKGK